MSAPVRFFAPKDRARVLAQTVNKPTGVIFAHAGAEFDLVALPTSRILTMFDLATMEAGADQGIEQFRELEAFVRDVLRFSAEAAARDAGAEFDPDVFGEWFERNSTIEMIKAATEKIVEATGLSIRPQNPAETPEPEPTKRRTRSTPSGAS